LWLQTNESLCRVLEATVPGEKATDGDYGATKGGLHVRRLDPQLTVVAV
jgi:hypothetical protein